MGSTLPCVGDRHGDLPAVGRRGDHVGAGRERLLPWSRLLGVGHLTRLVDAEGRHPPEGQAGVADRVLYLTQAPVGRFGQVDRRPPARRRRHPRGGEEVSSCPDQILGPAADPFRVGQHHVGAGRHQLRQQRQPPGNEHRDQRLHTFDGDTGGELAEHLREGRVTGTGCGQLRRPSLHLRCEQNLPAGLGGERRSGRPGIDGSLIGDGEPADVGDLVAEELHPHRVIVGRREDVENAAADGDLAPLLHHVNSGVGQRDEPLHQPAQVGPVADVQDDGRHLAQVGCHRLDQRADGGDHHGQLPAWILLRVGEPPQRRQPFADCVGSRRQPLVRQGLPRREDHHFVRPEQVGDGRGGHLGLPPGGRHEQHRYLCAADLPVGSQSRGQERARAGRGDDPIAGHAGRRDDVADDIGGEDGIEEARQRGPTAIGPARSFRSRRAGPLVRPGLCVRRTFRRCRLGRELLRHRKTPRHLDAASPFERGRQLR